ncbi:hypothetical protein EJ02DRAFT_454233 [Clathrospora elynae]|uniref:Uncharacterized protein n=1 Tax=Clathrospora elynae TaxID=706981 RepID=A0A6A5SS44_9PLEO|nr:hypothetical protein EJ02DRAFT_454233 [Clathrospora elynae]
MASPQLVLLPSPFTLFLFASLALAAFSPLFLFTVLFASQCAPCPVPGLSTITPPGDEAREPDSESGVKDEDSDCDRIRTPPPSPSTDSLTSTLLLSWSKAASNSLEDNKPEASGDGVGDLSCSSALRIMACCRRLGVLRVGVMGQGSGRVSMVSIELVAERRKWPFVDVEVGGGKLFVADLELERM